jgi:hypothetical protein
MEHQAHWLPLAHPAGGVRTVTVESGGHKHVMRYEAGRPDEAISRMMKLAGEQSDGFGWFEAAVGSFQVAGRSPRTTLPPDADARG